MAQRILILGATSTITRHIALELVQADDSVCLAARDTAELDRIAADLQLRNRPASLVTCAFDASAFETHAKFVEAIVQELGGLDTVVVGTGELGDQNEARHSITAIRRIVDSNYLGIATVLAPIADFMETQGSGRIAVLSSVAGDRGRQSNYIYGSAKSGMASYLQGLRNRLAKSGVKVTTIKLGFVDTKMVFGKPGMFLVASPQAAAKAVAAKIRSGADIAYVPWFWRYIMLIIIHIPEKIFKKMKL